MSVDLQFDVTGSTAQGQEIAKRASVSDAPFLGAKFWEPQTVIIGTVAESRKTQNGPVIALELIEPATVEVYNREGIAEEWDVVRIGNLAGFSHARRHALDKQKQKYFVEGDVLRVTCTGIQKADKEGYSDSPNFDIAVKFSEKRVPF